MPTSSDHPPISDSANVGGVQRTLSGDYVWWFAEMVTVKLRVQKRDDSQGIPSWALRQIADDMDRRAAGDQLTAPPEPGWDTQIQAMTARIIAGLRAFPQTHDELWRTLGRPQGNASFAFDVALNLLADRGDIRATDVNGRKAYSLKAP